MGVPSAELKKVRRRSPLTIGKLLRRVEVKDPGLADDARRSIAEVVSAIRGGVGFIPRRLEKDTIGYWERELRRTLKGGL